MIHHTPLGRFWLPIWLKEHDDRRYFAQPGDLPRKDSFAQPLHLGHGLGEDAIFAKHAG
jgi:hypothetical protein